MSPKRISAADLSGFLRPGGLTLVSSCSAESEVLARAVKLAGDDLGDMCFSGVFVPGLNKHTYLNSAQARALTFFVTPQLSQVKESVQFLPLCYTDILAHLKRLKPTAALVMLSPPDPEGRCSFGTEVSFIADLWHEIPTKIAHINPQLPVTKGIRGPHIDELTAIIEGPQELVGTGNIPPDERATRIAQNVAQYIQNGATLQTGLGKIPGAVLKEVSDRRSLRLHTGLVGDAALDLLNTGALSGCGCATVGTAIGTNDLYNNIGREEFNFQPVSVTHNANLMAGLENFVAINSAFEVDLFGQAYAERSTSGLASGPGGAADFARGAKNANGLRILALPASFGRSTIQSKIISPDQAQGPVSLSRMDTDIVVTEFGAAELAGKSHEQRAEALISIADPMLRDALSKQWYEYTKTVF